MSSPIRTSRRLSVLSALVLLVVGAFMVRLVDIQVARAAELSEEAEARRTVDQVVWAERGEILDRAGNVLAENVDRYDVTVSPRHVADFRRDGATVTVVQALTDISAVTGATLETMLASVQEDPESDFGYLVKGITTEQYRAVDAMDIPWVYFERHQNRFYPFGAVTGTLTGMLGRDGPLEGVEVKWDECLAGVNGVARYEKGLDGVRIPGTTQTETPPEDGGTVHLTIDSDLQWYVLQQMAKQAEVLQAEAASAMVVEVSTGEVLAVADWPTFDPNNFENTPQEHLRASSFTAAYEPGSTIKSVTIAALIDAGLTSPTEALVAPGILELGGGDYIKNAGGVGTRNLTTAGVLSLSANTGTAELSKRLTPQQIHDYFRAFGFGEETAVHFLGEQAGYLPDPDTVDGITRLTQSFGQGMSATNAQVAAAYQVLANGGVKLPLRLVNGCEGVDGERTELPVEEPVRVVSEEAADQVVAILETVPVTGTLANRVTVPGYRIAVKTGTAEVAEQGQYGANRVISLAGMVPAEDPQYVIVVSFVKPQTIRFSSGAAPAFQAIAEHVLKHYRVPPSSEAAQLYPLRW